MKTITLLLFTICLCFDSEAQENQANLSLGDTYQGGAVFYILQASDEGYETNRKHGLIVATSDQGLASWEDSKTLCNDLSSGGFTDWYLPTKEELTKLYQNKESVKNGGTTLSDFYWSSSEESTALAFWIGMEDGSVSSSLKRASIYVRAVRKF